MSLIFNSAFINNFNDAIGTFDGIPLNITWKSTNRGLKPELNGSNAKITYGNIGTIKTIALWVHLRSTTESILDLNGTQTIDIAAGTVRGNSWTSPTVYVDGAATDALSDLTGYHHIVITTATGIAASAVVAGLISAAYGNLIIDDIRGYDNVLLAADVLTLYNATSGEYGPSWAEQSYQHDPAAIIPAQTGEVLRIGGKLPGDAVDTISDRALSNDATIHGAMPADGFLIGGRRYAVANSNHLSLVSNIIFTNDNSFEFIFRYIPLPDVGICGKTDSNVFSFLRLRSGKFDGETDTDNDTVVLLHNGLTLTSGQYYHVVIAQDTGNAWTLFIDGVAYGTDTTTNSNMTIGTIGAAYLGNTFNDIMCFFIIHGNALQLGDAVTNFNTLAVLPFWSIDYRDYPDNVTTYTDSFPHSSSIIASGTFKVDDDKLTCTSAGTLTYSASNEFDGQEYITVTIAGTEYSGTGTITQGNTTVSAAQGSNKITIAADNGDVIDAIDITFREPVST